MKDRENKMNRRNIKLGYTELNGRENQFQIFSLFNIFPVSSIIKPSNTVANKAQVKKGPVNRI